ncbi:imidazolonepropionase-like domain-containing protein [Kitasatospora sp. NPDC101183]|uniref:imidazolonepropionase-like domain-containing protein n=1 Tax=Kitasatospora sp. NPDC101183 TaxID=3364100 RepID=UPI003821C300
MLTLHRAAFLLSDPGASSLADGAVVVSGETVVAVGPYASLAGAHVGARVRDWGAGSVLAPGLRQRYGHRLLEHDYHPDPREGVGAEPVADALAGSGDEVRCGASARRGLQRMLGYGVTAVAGPFERASVRTAVARSGVLALPGGLALPGEVEGSGPLDPLEGLAFEQAAFGRLEAGGRANFAVFALGGGEHRVEPAAGGCLATVLGGRLVYRRR